MSNQNTYDLTHVPTCPSCRGMLRRKGRCLVCDLHGACTPVYVDRVREKEEDEDDE
jgi:hypothetical protein